MTSIYQWLNANLDVVFFASGISFMIIGVLVLVQLRKESQFDLAEISKFFIGYALLRAMVEFIHMFELIKGRNAEIHFIEQVLQEISFIMLFVFGFQLLGIANIKVYPRIPPLNSKRVRFNLIVIYSKDKFDWISVMIKMCKSCVLLRISKR